MNITVAENLASFYSIAAWRIAGEILKRPNERTTLGLATGRTTTGIHAELAAIHAAHPFSVSRVCVFGMDEIANVDRSYAGSCYSILHREVVKPLGIYEENFFMPQTRADDLTRECRAYEAVIAARGGIDLQVVGIGENGHIGFNQPGTPFHSDAFVGRVDEELEARVRRETGMPEKTELGGMTLGIRSVMHSRRILLVACGAQKAEMIRRAIQGPVTEEVPASVLQLHPFCEAILDPEAAALLEI